LTAPNTPSASAPGTTTTGGAIGGVPANASAGTQTAIGNHSQNATFPTLNPPPMGTAVYAPDVTILIRHNGIQYDVSKDIVRGQVLKRENSASSLFFTLANQSLRYNGLFSRMDTVVLYLTRVSKIQVFSGYLDTVPFLQAYPGTVDFVATCTLKRLMHTWWNPSLPDSQAYFDQIGQETDTGDGSFTDSGIGNVLRNIMRDVGKWTPDTVHIQDVPQQFISSCNQYLVANQIPEKNQALGQAFTGTILGDDTSPGPMAAVGYQPGDPLGTGATAANANTQFYISQIVKAVDDRGMGPIAANAANAQNLQGVGSVLESAGAAGQTSFGGQAMATDVKQAGQQVAQYAANQMAQNSSSDAAILALACAMVESGGGTPNLLMYANPADPPSMSFWHDAVGHDGSSVGLFQQQATGQWGTTAQRMNPYSSASMFLDALQSKTGWRNMDPGQAIWQVQQSVSSSIPKYSAAATVAAPLIQAYRQAQQSAKNTANSAFGAVGAGGLGNMATGGANAVASTAGNAVGAAANSALSGAAVSAVRPGKPAQDSECAINAAYSMYLTPYLETPEGMDCSHLVQLSFLAGTGIDVTRSTNTQRSAIPSIPPASAQRGDVLQTNNGGHTGIYLGGGMWINTGGPTGRPGKVEPINPAQCYWAGRVCPNGGVDPTAPFTPVAISAAGIPTPPPGTGVPPGTGNGSPSSQEPIARNLFSYIFEPDAYAAASALYFSGEKAYIDSQPLIQIVKSLCMASLRNFQSGPDGSFCAYYPDPFGVDGKPAIFNLEDIELTDASIILSDNDLTTHVYIEGDYTMIGQADQAVGWITTSGVATVENPFLFQRLKAFAVGDVDNNLTAQQLMQRFGVRPYKDSYPVAGNPALEFLLAVQIFTGKWAGQYSTTIGVTFLPELLPGSRINLVGHNLSVYVSEVVHEFDWERGFRTSATVSAATNPKASSNFYSSFNQAMNNVSTTPGNSTSNNGQPVTGSTGS